MADGLEEIKELLNRYYLTKTELVHRRRPREIVYPRRRRNRRLELNLGNLAFAEAASAAYGSKKTGDLPPAAESVAKALKGLKLAPEKPKPNWELFLEEVRQLAESKAVPVPPTVKILLT